MTKQHPIPLPIHKALDSILQALENEYSTATGASPQKIWRRAADNGYFRGNKSYSSQNLDSIVEWFSRNWPEGAVWPSDFVERPIPVIHGLNDGDGK